MANLTKNSGDIRQNHLRCVIGVNINNLYWLLCINFLNI